MTCDFESIFGDCLNIETNENQVRDCLTKLVHNKTINSRTSRKRTIYNLSKDLPAPVVDVNNDLYIEIQKLHDELTDYKEYAESKFSQLSTEIIKLTKVQGNNSKIESPRSDSFTEKLEEEIKYSRKENKNKTEVIKLLTTDAVLRDEANSLNNLMYKVAIFADDTSLYTIYNEKSNLPDRTELSNNLQHDFSSVSNWGSKWLVTFNSKKNQLRFINRYRIPVDIPISISGKPLPSKPSLHLLGLSFSSDPTWNDYIKSIAKMCLYEG